MTEDTNFKYCRSCDSTKVITDFYVCSANKDGRYTYCSVCCKKRRDEAGYAKYAWNPVKARERARRARQSASNKAYEKSFRKEYLRTIPGRSGKLLAAAKRRALQKEIECSLTREWVLERLEAGVCEATGVEFSYIVPENRTRAWNAPSIDRRDPAKGYTPENCWMVCLLYNIAKGEQSEEEMLHMARCLVNKADNNEA